MNSGTGLNILQKAEPDHYFDVGIAEQQAVLFAAGLALEGAKPVVRDLLDVPAARLRPDRPRRLPAEAQRRRSRMDRAGLVGDDGPTHHGAFDIAYLRCLPNIVLMAPRDEAMLAAHAAHRADLRRRPGRAALPARRGRRRRRCRAAESRRSRSARGEILREGERVALVGYGTGVQKALEAADLLAEGGLDVTVADARFAKPIDAELLDRARGRARAARHRRGGRPGRRLRLGRLGGAQRRGRRRSPRILRVGLPDRYVTHGKPALLHAEVGFTGRAIAQRIEAAIGGRHGRARQRVSAGLHPQVRALIEVAPPRGRAAAPPTSRPSAPPTCRPRSSSAGAVEQVARVEDVVIPAPRRGRVAGARLLADRRRRRRSACSCGCTAAAGASATSRASTASRAQLANASGAVCL